MTSSSIMRILRNNKDTFGIAVSPYSVIEVEGEILQSHKNGPYEPVSLRYERNRVGIGEGRLDFPLGLRFSVEKTINIIGEGREGRES